MADILIVDDELSIRESFSLILGGSYTLHLAASGEAALKIIADQRIDLVYLDVRMPGLDGLETLAKIKQLKPNQETIMVTAVNDMQKAGQAVKLGATDYIVKPFDVANIIKLTEQTLRKKAILRQSSTLKKSLDQPDHFLGQSEKIRVLLDKIEQAANDQHSLLIVGEPGTEKELVARLIHQKSQRADSPFNNISLAQNMPEAKIRTLLLGFAGGANTSELSAHLGLIEQTQSGTLLIDNIEALPPKLLAELKNIKAEARLIGAASSDLLGRNFSPAVIEIPPLRQRTSDLPLMINQLLELFSVRCGKEVQFSPAALAALSSYTWPGNREELSATLQTLVLASARPTIELAELPFSVLLAVVDTLEEDLLAKFERVYIKKIHQLCGQEHEKTAAFLNVNPNVLAAKL